MRKLGLFVASVAMIIGVGAAAAPARAVDQGVVEHITVDPNNPGAAAVTADGAITSIPLPAVGHGAVDLSQLNNGLLHLCVTIKPSFSQCINI